MPKTIKITNTQMHLPPIPLVLSTKQTTLSDSMCNQVKGLGGSKIYINGKSLHHFVIEKEKIEEKNNKNPKNRSRRKRKDDPTQKNKTYTHITQTLDSELGDNGKYVGLYGARQGLPAIMEKVLKAKLEQANENIGLVPIDGGHIYYTEKDGTVQVSTSYFLSIKKEDGGQFAVPIKASGHIEEGKFHIDQFESNTEKLDNSEIKKLEDILYQDTPSAKKMLLNEDNNAFFTKNDNMQGNPTPQTIHMLRANPLQGDSLSLDNSLSSVHKVFPVVPKDASAAEILLPRMDLFLQYSLASQYSFSPGLFGFRMSQFTPMKNTEPHTLGATFKVSRGFGTGEEHITLSVRMALQSSSNKTQSVKKIMIGGYHSSNPDMSFESQQSLQHWWRTLHAHNMPQKFFSEKKMQKILPEPKSPPPQKEKKSTPNKIKAFFAKNTPNPEKEEILSVTPPPVSPSKEASLDVPLDVSQEMSLFVRKAATHTLESTDTKTDTKTDTQTHGQPTDTTKKASTEDQPNSKGGLDAVLGAIRHLVTVSTPHFFTVSIPYFFTVFLPKCFKGKDTKQDLDVPLTPPPFNTPNVL